MQMNTHSLLWPRLMAFSLSALAAAGAAYWVLQWPDASVLSSSPMAISTTDAPDPQGLVRLLGGAGANAAQAPVTQAPVTQAPSRFVLTGVVADRAQSGAALIALDGQASKPYRVGASVADGLVLQSVTARRAVLAPALSAPAALTLEMKPLGK